MGTIGPDDSPSAKVYFATNTGTKADVTTDTQILIWAIHICNNTAAKACLQLFDKQSAAVTVGTTAPDFEISLPASGSATFLFGEKPLKFSTGFTIASTTTPTGATGASTDVSISFMSNP